MCQTIAIIHYADPRLEKQRVHQAFTQNGYPSCFIQQVATTCPPSRFPTNPGHSTQPAPEPLATTSTLSYVQGFSEPIWRLLQKVNIKTSPITPYAISSQIQGPSTSIITEQCCLWDRMQWLSKDICGPVNKITTLLAEETQTCGQQWWEGCACSSRTLLEEWTQDGLDDSKGDWYVPFLARQMCTGVLSIFTARRILWTENEASFLQYTVLSSSLSPPLFSFYYYIYYSWLSPHCSICILFFAIFPTLVITYWTMCALIIILFYSFTYLTPTFLCTCKVCILHIQTMMPG